VGVGVGETGTCDGAGVADAQLRPLYLPADPVSRTSYEPGERVQEERVITCCTTRPVSVPGTTIRAMPGDPGRLPHPSPRPRPARAQRAVAGELLGRVRAELPAGGGLGKREHA
jgi:hypothetical protein